MVQPPSHAARTRSALTLALAAALGRSASAQSQLAVRGVPDGAPFAVRATADERILTVTLDLASEWHAYARDVGGGRPVAVTLDDDGDFAVAGALIVQGEVDGKLEGRVRLTLPLLRDGAGATLSGSLALQVCDALECLAPMTLELEGEVAPLDVLLVVAKLDERAERIRAWLASRGFAVTVSTYGAVELASADAADVVVADSDVFQKHGVGRDVIARFPRTATPLVAVGFIGTELCEAHGLAMTSGYI